MASRSTGSASLVYRHVGTGHVSYATVPGTGPATYSLVDASGSRLALDTGGTTAWALFDLHGNLAGAQAEATGTIVSALRYDAYGQLLDEYTAGSGATDTPWRFQGRLDVSPDADEALYDYGARMYRPSAGTFTQLDTYSGAAQNPTSMNRFIYAHGNPVTLVDPDGHAPMMPMIDGQCAGPTSCSKIKPIQPGAGPAVTPTYTSDPTPGVAHPTPFVYMPNPLNLPTIPAYEDMTPRERLGYILAANAASPHCPRQGCPDPGTFFSIALQMITGPGDIYQLGVIGFGYDPIANQGLSEQERQEAGVLFAGFGGLVPAQAAMKGARGPAAQKFEDAMSRLPAYSGGKTQGVFSGGSITDELISGYSGPSSAMPKGTPGFNNIVRAHVEGHAAALMRTNGIESAVLYLNQAPCAWSSGCNAMLPRMLPAGAELNVYWPGGSQTYLGIGD